MANDQRPQYFTSADTDKFWDLIAQDIADANTALPVDDSNKTGEDEINAPAVAQHPVAPLRIYGPAVLGFVDRSDAEQLLNEPSALAFILSHWEDEPPSEEVLERVASSDNGTTALLERFFATETDNARATQERLLLVIESQRGDDKREFDAILRISDLIEARGSDLQLTVDDLSSLGFADEFLLVERAGARRKDPTILRILATPISRTVATILGDESVEESRVSGRAKVALVDEDGSVIAEAPVDPSTGEAELNLGNRRLRSDVTLRWSAE